MKNDEFDPTQCSVRPLTKDDALQVATIEAKSHLSPWSVESVIAELSKPFCHFWVLTDDETDEKIFAYIVFWVIDQECRILNVVVDAPYRGLGLAQRMIRAALSSSIKAEVKKSTLEVRKSNQAAIELYQKIGFSISHIRKGFYSNGEDAYVMDLSLEDQKEEF